MSATEIVNDQMEKMRNELAVANQQIGVIMECLAIHGMILKKVEKTTNPGMIFTESQYQSLVDLHEHMYNACKRA
jgi:hypothetical protein